MMLNKINLKNVFILVVTHAAIFSAGVYYGLLVYEEYINDQYIVIPESFFKQQPTKNNNDKGFLSV